MRRSSAEAFAFATSFPERLSRQGNLTTPIIAKCAYDKVSSSDGDVFCAKLMVEYFDGPLAGQVIPAWDLFHVSAATRMSHIDEDGWCCFHFDSPIWELRNIHLDAPKENFKFRFVAEFYVMRERKGTDLGFSVRERGEAENIGGCPSPLIEVDS